MKTLLSLTVLLSFVLVSACGGSGASTETASTDETSGTETEAPADAFAVLTVEQVAAGIAESRLTVFDANSRETFEAGHVPGATWVHYDSVSTATLPADQATPIVFYCGSPSCGAAPTAAETAIELGYTNVSVMRAGISGWREAGQPVETAEPTPAAE
jgi:rhodanese-related sulfurtransferase